MQEHNFSKRKDVLPLPNLSEVQLESYQWFRDTGIQEVLDELGTIEDDSGRGWILSMSDSRFHKPNISIEEALRIGRTYDAPWYMTATLKDPVEGKENSQEIYMGDVPLMTEKGTFIINGVERVIVSQLIRSEGVIFTGEVSSVTGQMLGGAKILPQHGAWLEITTSRRGVISVRIDRRRKLSIATLLRVFGLETDEDILDAFAEVETDPEINYIEKSLAKDPSASYDEACLEVYRKVRPGEPLVLENAKELVKEMFFNPKRYSLGEVGRFKLNQVLGLNFPNTPKGRVLQLEDLIEIVSRIIQMNNGIGEPTDVDNLGNRRVRRVGELLQNRVRVGFLRLARNVRGRMTLQPRDELPNPSKLISPRAVTANVQSFFATGRLSQFQDQQNPLTSLAHIRRLSVLGPGGLTKERASMAVRDVHYSSFGRICPVRTPEGPSIGLINYLAMYSRVNEYGFVETPYIKLESDSKGVKVTNEIEFLAAYDEEEKNITDASVEVDSKGYITVDQVPLRQHGEFFLGNTSDAEYMEVIPKQIVGISAGLIPFLSNDDITRALVAAQQLSQAVPLIAPDAPLVGTGIEKEVAVNSGAVVLAEKDGEVVYADSSRIEIKYKGDKKETIYEPNKFVKSNVSTNYNQSVKVETGQKLEKGDILYEGPASDDGYISLGANVKVAYMIWEGYEFEDGIVISDRLVKEDVLTSIHINDYDISVVETKLGAEELTNDIPNVSEYALRNLDEDGIVTIGSDVRSGDILVGKVAPKGEVDLSAEERLLRAIFGEQAKEVRDTSLRMPHGSHGVVIGVKRVSREDNDQLTVGVLEEITVYVAERRKIQVGDKLAGRHGNKGVISAIVPQADMPHLEDGTPVDVVFSSEAVLKRMNMGQILEAPLGLAGRKLGKRYLVPPLEVVPESEIVDQLKEAGLPETGKFKLVDGRTGEYFHDKVVVGETYVLKLVHMSEEKMHARSTGPYSLVTQQPLGGKSQFGGQRFGEMEVWALEAYGAAHTLKEMLTIKSDDLIGRTKAYSSIIQGRPIVESTIPETFKLLVRQLNGLGIGLEPLRDEREELVLEEDTDQTEDATEAAEDFFKSDDSGDADEAKDEDKDENDSENLKEEE
ncbi:DNA-directed RNA polymerase subunit beta [candidate division WWE3 bacterium]|nr:DNA-directed RNA polymerase subunit beta [candidate division WWE3 bacterium]